MQLNREIVCGVMFVTACATATGTKEDDAGTENDAPTMFADSSTPIPDTGMTTKDTGGPPPPCTNLLIDDMEHMDGSILSVCGRQGFWFTFNDATTSAVQTPAAGTNFLPTLIPNGGRGSSMHAAHTSGSGFSVWGAGMGFDLNDLGGSSMKQVYDASAHTGFTFWAMAGSGGATSVRFNVPTKGTDPIGGVCTPAAKCSDHFGSTVTLTTTWQQITVQFSALKQLGWGTPTTFIASQLYGVELQFDPNATFDLWVDDISFE